MKPPRMTNYELLKRPKTNRDSTARPVFLNQEEVNNTYTLLSDRAIPEAQKEFKMNTSNTISDARLKRPKI